MCNYNNYIFVLIIGVILSNYYTNAGPLKKKIGKDYEDDIYDYLDYDLSYDQRQNGTENFRLKIDDVLISLPGPGSGSGSGDGSTSSDTILNALDLLAGELLAGGYDDDDDSDEDYYNFNSNGSTTTVSNIKYELPQDYNITTNTEENVEETIVQSSDSENKNSENSDNLNNMTITQKPMLVSTTDADAPMKKSHSGRNRSKQQQKRHFLSLIRPLLQKYRKP